MPFCIQFKEFVWLSECTCTWYINSNIFKINKRCLRHSRRICVRGPLGYFFKRKDTGVWCIRSVNQYKSEIERRDDISFDKGER